MSRSQVAKVQLNIDVLSSLKRLSDGSNEVYRQLRERADDSFKDEVGQLAIQFIVDRTLEGKDKNGKAFKAYKPSYYNSKIFDIYGKSRGSVNLELTGEMHASIDVLKPTQKGVLIGITDFENETKADAHINGKGNLPKRDFWGINNDELDDIVRPLVKEFQDGIFPIEVDIPGLSTSSVLEDNATQIFVETDF